MRPSDRLIKRLKSPVPRSPWRVFQRIRHLGPMTVTGRDATAWRSALPTICHPGRALPVTAGNATVEGGLAEVGADSGALDLFDRKPSSIAVSVTRTSTPPNMTIGRVASEGCKTGLDRKSTRLNSSHV